MIFGTERKKVVRSAKDFIEESRAVFYLTGSRAFHTATILSDWDYFVDRNEITDDELSAAGFTLENESYYGDALNASVWRQANVHIQVVWDAALKLRIQNAIAPLVQSFKPSKAQAKQLWSVAYALTRPSGTY